MIGGSVTGTGHGRTNVAAEGIDIEDGEMNVL